jgi:hypothetical protein
VGYDFFEYFPKSRQHFSDKYVYDSRNGILLFGKFADNNDVCIAINNCTIVVLDENNDIKGFYIIPSAWVKTK